LLNATSQIVEVQAGLARLALQSEDNIQAEQYALQIKHYLDQEGPQGLELPILVYLSCIRVFKVLGDTSLLEHTLQNGRREIKYRLAKISDVDWGKTYLEALPENRELMSY